MNISRQIDLYNRTQYLNLPHFYKLCNSHHNKMAESSHFTAIINGYFCQVEKKNNSLNFILAATNSESYYDANITQNQLVAINCKLKSLENLYQHILTHSKDPCILSITQTFIIIKVQDSPNITIKIQPIAQESTNQENQQSQDYTSNPIAISNTNTMSASSKTRQEIICQKAAELLKKGHNMQDLMKILRISERAAQKMRDQFQKFGKIFPPRKTEKPQTPEVKALKNFIMQPVTPNMKLPGENVKKIKQILYQLVKEGKMKCLQEMQQFLAERSIWRSLSSIYRYVADIKADHKELQCRNYTMNRKQQDTNEERKKTKEMLNTYYNQPR